MGADFWVFYGGVTGSLVTFFFLFYTTHLISDARPARETMAGTTFGSRYSRRAPNSSRSGPLNFVRLFRGHGSKEPGSPSAEISLLRFHQTELQFLLVWEAQQPRWLRIQ